MKTITWAQLNALLKKAWAVKDGDDRVCIYFENRDAVLKLRFNETENSDAEDLCFTEKENSNIEYNGSEVLLKTSDGEIIWLMPLYELYVKEALKQFEV